MWERIVFVRYSVERGVDAARPQRHRSSPRETMSMRIALTVILCLMAPAAHAQLPAWLTEAMAREAKPMPARSFESTDKWVKGTVPATVVGRIELEDASYSIEFNLDAESPAYCEVFRDSIDMATVLKRVLDRSLELIAEESGKIEMRRLSHLDAGVANAVPFMAARWLYRTNDGKQQRIGQVKQFAMSSDGYGVYCAHGELGYRATFDRFTQALAESLTIATTARDPYLEEVTVTSINGMNAGVSRTTFERDPDGDTMVRITSSMLVPTSKDEVMTTDALSIEWVRPDASLINAVTTVVRNGTTTVDLGLERDDDRWIIEGTIDEKEVSIQLGADAVPTTTVRQMSTVRELAARENLAGATATMRVWGYSSPDKLVDTIVTLSGKTGEHFTGTMARPQATADITVDRHGSVVSARIPAGAAPITMTRVYVKGLE